MVILLSVRDVFGEELMTPESKETMVATLKMMPISAARKESVYKEWCSEVGVPVTAKDVEQIMRKVEKRG